MTVLLPGMTPAAAEPVEPAEPVDPAKTPDQYPDFKIFTAEDGSEWLARFNCSRLGFYGKGPTRAAAIENGKLFYDMKRREKKR